MYTVIYTRSLLHGGAEKQSLLLAEELQKTQHTLLIVHTHDDERSFLDFSRVKNVIFLRGSGLNKLFCLFKVLKKYAVINLICFLPVNNIYGTIAGKLAGVRNILCGIRGSKYKGWLRTSVLRFICNQMKVVFISNNYLSKDVYCALGFNERQISVVHNAIVVPDSNYKIDRSIAGHDFYNLLSVGRFVMEKDFVMLLQAVHMLVHTLTLTNIHLKLVGYGPLEGMLALKIKELDLSSYVDMYDGRTIDLHGVYLSSDLYLQSSISEGMPNTVMEAMSYKMPIVATDAGDTKYLVSVGNGVLVKAGDFKGTAMGIRNIISDETAYKKMSNQSFNKISKGFSVKRMSQEYMRFLK